MPTSIPFVSRTRAIFRSAEFGFFGRHRRDARADAPLLRGALERGRLRLLALGRASFADELVDSRHRERVRVVTDKRPAGRGPTEPARHGSEAPKGRQTAAKPLRNVAPRVAELYWFRRRFPVPDAGLGQAPACPGPTVNGAVRARMAPIAALRTALQPQRRRLPAVLARAVVASPVSLVAGHPTARNRGSIRGGILARTPGWATVLGRLSSQGQARPGFSRPRFLSSLPVLEVERGAVLADLLERLEQHVPAGTASRATGSVGPISICR